MIEEATCLILGAGASAPYGLPTGNELRDLILAAVSLTGTKTAEKFRMTGFHGHRLGHLNADVAWSTYLQILTDSANLESIRALFRRKFFHADRSIDWFLRHNNAEFGEIARLQIAAVLLYCEQIAKLSGDWYRLLLEQVFPTDLDQVDLGKLSVITFNYDRSFERYFLGVLENQYGLTPDHARERFSKIRMRHVYGQLGSLDKVEYGNVSRAVEAARGIELVRPEVDKRVQEQILPLIEESTYINFIGFGFDDDNIELLKPEIFKGKRVYSTSIRLGVRTRAKVQRTLHVQFHDPKNSPELDAVQLLQTKDLFGPKIKPNPSKQRLPARAQGAMWTRRWEI